MSTQRVDPFIPVAPRRQGVQPYPGLVNNIPRLRPSRTTDNVANVIPRAVPVPRPKSEGRPVPPRVVTRAVPTESAKEKAVRPKHRILRSLRMPAAVTMVMLGGIFIQSAAIGEAAIAGYAVFALWKRVPSRTSFLLALLSLISVVTLLLFKTSDGLAATFTTYTFLLLGVGVVGSIREMRAEDA